jgi:hypothetical protein
MSGTLRACAVLLGACLIASAAAARAEDGEREVWVNGLRMSADEIMLLESAFEVCVQDGAYLYDPVSGDLRAVALSELSGPDRGTQYAHAGALAPENGAE